MKKNNTMPKLKTRKITLKRFKITGTGKVIHRTKGIRHIRSKKNKARQRRTDIQKTLTNIKYITVVKQSIGAK
jgi:large subunit ribosomal protein L35